MAGTTRGNSFDLVSVSFVRMSSTGIPYGQLDPDATESGDTISHALSFIGDGLSVQLPTISYKRATFGGSRQLGSAYMGTNPLEEFEIQLSSFDANLESMLKGGAVNTSTISGATGSSPNNNNTDLNRVGVFFSARHQDRVTGSDGDNKYITWEVPNCTGYIVESPVSTSDGDNPQPVTVRLTPSFSSKHIWGVAFGSDEDLAGNKTEIYRFTSSNPFAMTTWIADGTETTFEVEYEPSSTDVTSGNTTHVFVDEGAVTAPSSFVVATGVVTVAAAGSDGDNHCAFYQVNPQFIAI